jgi:hypothetical protein
LAGERYQLKVEKFSREIEIAEIIGDRPDVTVRFRTL